MERTLHANWDRTCYTDHAPFRRRSLLSFMPGGVTARLSLSIVLHCRVARSDTARPSGRVSAPGPSAPQASARSHHSTRAADASTGRASVGGVGADRARAGEWPVVVPGDFLLQVVWRTETRGKTRRSDFVYVG